MVTQQVSVMGQPCIGRLQAARERFGTFVMCVNGTCLAMKRSAAWLISAISSPSVRIIGVIFGFPHHGGDYLSREIGIWSGMVLTGGFNTAGLKAGFGRGRGGGGGGGKWE